MGHSGGILSTWEKRSSHVPVLASALPSMPILPDTETDRQKSPSIRGNESIKNTSPQPAEVEPENQHCQSRENTTPEHKSVNKDDNDKKIDQLVIRSHRTSRSNSEISEPLLTTAYCNGIVAKNLKIHNQKHHMLADAVDHPSSRPLQVNKSARCRADPQLDTDLEDDAWTPAIGCKVFQSPGPTQCSKLKIFRPKTTLIPTDRKKSSGVDKRPKTAPRNKRLSEMDLAIYWDVSASKRGDTFNKIEGDTVNTIGNKNASDSRSQNGKIEVSSLKSEPDKVTEIVRGEEVSEVQDLPLTVNRPEVEESKTPNQQRGSINSALPREVQDGNSIRSNSIEPNISSQRKCKHRCTRHGSSTNISQMPDIRSENSTHPVKSRKLYASAPNLMDVGIQVNGSSFKTTARACDACNVKRTYSQRSLNIAATDKYKLAFKAGKPNTLAVDEVTLERMQKARNLRVPKPKIPFAKKSYSIRTLVPPFSVWPRAAGQDYPDHWRLVTVYQHSYKPMDTRKVSLMRTVFQ